RRSSARCDDTPHASSAAESNDRLRLVSARCSVGADSASAIAATTQPPSSPPPAGVEQKSVSARDLPPMPSPQIAANIRESHSGYGNSDCSHESPPAEQAAGHA